MKYTWRLIITTILLIANGISMSMNFTRFQLYDVYYWPVIFYLLNLALGWILGYQFDKYFFTKNELSTAKTSLGDYSYALDSLTLGVGITSENGQFEFVNEAHCKLYGYSKEELLSMKWQECYMKEELDNLRGIAVPPLLEHGMWRGETIGVRKDGSTFPQELFISTIKGSQKVICVVHDISEQKQYIDYIKHMAEHNELTKLPNRRKLLKDINLSIEESMNTSLLFVDLDRFKLVNDTLGHDIGDELLVHVAVRLLSFQNEFIKVYHQGGDEFIILIQNRTIKDVQNIAYQIIKEIKEPFSIKGNEVIVTSSIGISRYPDHTQDVDELIKMADTAMYYAKLEGKNTFQMFNMNLKVKLERNALIESELRRAIANNEFSIHYQPKFNLDNLELVGLEALIRWENPNLGNVSPIEFIPIAEDTGLISEIGSWVIKEVIQQMKKWHSIGYSFVKTSVNVSQRQFRDKSIVEHITSFLHTFQIEPKYFEIEITESVMEDFELVIPQLKALKAKGVGITIDDFGTGYSSLNFLKKLPVDTLKIDRSFIRDLLIDDSNYLLVKAIIEIGNTLNLDVVAEGIESVEHLEKLKQLECPIGQGFYFSKPLDVFEIQSKFLKKDI